MISLRWQATPEGNHILIHVSDDQWLGFVRAGYAVIPGNRETRRTAQELLPIAEQVADILAVDEEAVAAEHVAVASQQPLVSKLARRGISELCTLGGNFLRSLRHGTEDRNARAVLANSPVGAGPGSLHIDCCRSGSYWRPPLAVIGLRLAGGLPPFAGGFVLSPGSHFMVRAALQRRLRDDQVLTERSHMEAIHEIGDFALVEEVAMEPGDMILMHGLTAHASVFNASDRPRLNLYYRIDLEGRAFDREEVPAIPHQEGTFPDKALAEFLAEPFGPFRVPEFVISRFHSSAELLGYGEDVPTRRARERNHHNIRKSGR